MCLMARKYTITQVKMLAVLADGAPHARKELHNCLFDNLGPLSNIRAHITRLRKILRPQGQDIICELHGRTLCYRHIKLLRKP